MMDQPVDALEMDAFVAACRRAGAMGLVRCSSGNLSHRVGEDVALLSATRSWMFDLRIDQVVVCRISDGEVLNGRRPSVESRFHLGILRARPEVSTVLHFQTPFATTLACRRDVAAVDCFPIPEIPYYIGPVGIVPYLPPGSEPLAEAVIGCMTEHDLAIMRNHGQVTVGTSYDDVIQKAVFFELACEVIHRAGESLSPLSREAAEAIRAEALKGREGKV